MIDYTAAESYRSYSFWY